MSGVLDQPECMISFKSEASMRSQSEQEASACVLHESPTMKQKTQNPNKHSEAKKDMKIIDSSILLFIFLQMCMCVRDQLNVKRDVR